MKKCFLLSLKCILLFALILGCSSLQVKREVNENTFVSSYPNVAIKLKPEFKYIGNPSEATLGKSVDNSRDLRVRWDSYCFVKADKDKAAKAVTIQIETVETRFISDFFRNVKNAAAKGTAEIGGKKFQYFTSVVEPTMDSLLTRFYTGQGYKMSPGLMTVLARIYGTRGDTLVKILYYEPLENPELNNMSWKNADDLTQKQIEYMKNFNSRAISAFELMSDKLNLASGDLQ